MLLKNQGRVFDNLRIKMWCCLFNAHQEVSAFWLFSYIWIQPVPIGKHVEIDKILSWCVSKFYLGYI